MKYTQKIIPEVTHDFHKNSLKEIIPLSKILYKKHLQGKSVINEDIGIKVFFSGAGKGKISYGGKKYSDKVASIIILDKLIKYAEYNNYGPRKEKDKKNIIGYLNFKAKGKINGVLKHFRITIHFKTDGKFYYNHEINEY